MLQYSSITTPPEQAHTWSYFVGQERARPGNQKRIQGLSSSKRAALQGSFKKRRGLAGCFAFKGKKKVAKLEDYLSDGEFGQSVVKRHQVWQKMWTEIDTQIQILQADLNSKIFNDLLTFAAGSCSTFTLDNLETSNKSMYKEIPTAALVTGVNTPDHQLMFATLISLLKERVSPLVAILRSKDCQNVKNTLSKTLSQIVDNPQLLHDEEEEEKELTQKNLPVTLSTLAQWYKHKFRSQLSPRKRKSTGEGDVRHKYPPVVVVLEDFESFLPHVIQDFITIASSYLNQLPIVFVFGIATAISAVHRLLPNAVSSLLCMEKFQAPPSSEYLTMLINQIIMTPKYPFKLGARVFQLLLDIFLYHDFSVLNFVKGFRFSLMDHYLNMSLSHLCCPLEEVHKKVKVMDAEEVETIRQLPSFMRFVEENPASHQSKLLLDEKFAKEAIVDLLKRMHSYHTNLFPVLRCLHKLVCKLPKHPLGKQQREVYSLVLESNIFETEAYKQSMELLRMLAKDELEEMLKQTIEVLTENATEAITYLPINLSQFMHRFNTLDDPMEEEEREEVEGSSLKVIPKQKNIHELRQRLKEMEKKKKKLSPYEKLRSEIIDYYDSVFRKYLVCPKILPLHEIFYYDSSSTVKKHLNASPRSATQIALSNPHHHLQSINCDEDENMSSAMPDVCIVYKLHLECGQFINLYDWLQAFVTVVSPDAEFDPKNPDKVLHARFIRAVSELQFLGFIKPTKRKTDHVARLTWGGC